MATEDATARARIGSIKADLRSTSTCSNATVTALQELLFRKENEPVQKENVRTKTHATPRIRSGATAAVTSVPPVKPTSIALAPREKYILATEVANTTLKTLADALKNPPTLRTPKANPSPVDDTRKPTRPRLGHVKSSSVSQRPLKERSVSQVSNSPQKSAPRRSSSYSSFPTAAPDPGLVTTAECTRIAFGYLGTPEATKFLGKDSQKSQYENGVLALIGKLVALGLDGLAIKEMRALKKRLDSYLDQDATQQRSTPRASQIRQERTMTVEKDNLATLLSFGTIDPLSPAAFLIATFQTYVLRIIAKLRRPRVIEAAWEHLRLASPSSPANLLCCNAKTPNDRTKSARQLESLAQIILTLCPSLSSSIDAGPLQPSAEIVLQYQQLAFVIRRKWWSLAEHRGDEDHDILDPFVKCLVTFARRSQLSPTQTYKIAKSLSMDLVGHFGKPGSVMSSASTSMAALNKILCSFAQAAGLPDEALQWLGPPSTTNVPVAKRTARLTRIATISLEAYLKGDGKPDLEKTVASALEALRGSLDGSQGALESLFVEVNALRRTATRVLVTWLSTPGEVSGRASIEQAAFSIIATSIHFTARFIGSPCLPEADPKVKLRYKERIDLTWKCLKSNVDSVVSCCRHTVATQEEWQELDTILQQCAHLLQRFEEEPTIGVSSELESGNLISSWIVKLSNAYWAVHLQLRKADLSPECRAMAMQRSVDLVQSRSQSAQEAGHLPMKLEQLGEALENLGRGRTCQTAFRQCIRAHLSPATLQSLSTLAANCSMGKTFSCSRPLGVLARVLKAYHRSFLKFSIQDVDDMAFYDDIGLQSGERGALLEWQLGLFLRTLARNRQWDSRLDQSIITIVERLRGLYTPVAFPVRNLRLSVLLLQLSQKFHHVSPVDNSIEEDPASAVSEDEGLVRFESHLKALHDLKQSMQQVCPSTSTIRSCCAIWETLLVNNATWDTLADCVDQVEDWLKDLAASVENLNAKGEEYLVLPVLQILVQVLDLKKDPDSSELVVSLSTMSLQFLRLGYTGKAGLCNARAEDLIKRQTVSTEARLRWHIAYAEYLLAIGNGAKCITLMSAAQSFALADCHFMDLAKPTTTLSGRVRFNRILADACYVHSLMASAVGSYREAAQHAKQCVTLNRRVWAALESRAKVLITGPVEGTNPNHDILSNGAFDPLSSMRSDGGMPLVMSVTHDALSGPEFWSLVPALYRALMQHSQIFAHQGLLHEAMYTAEQAEKVASSTNSPTLMLDNASWRADCWAQSGRHDKAESILASFEQKLSRKCLSVVGYHSAVARVHHCKEQYTEEVACYETMEQLLDELTESSFIYSLEKSVSPVDVLAKGLENMSLDMPLPRQTKQSTVTRSRKPAVKSTVRAVPKPTATARSRSKVVPAGKGVPKSSKVAASALSEPSVTAEQCHVLSVMKASVLDRRVLANILQDDLTTALAVLGRAEDFQSCVNRDISRIWATFKASFAQSVKQIAEDFTVNTLPESTIAFPAIGLTQRRLSEGATGKYAALPPSKPPKGARAKKPTKENFLTTLGEARERLVEAHGICAANGSNHLFQQISMALGHVTVLLSAVTVVELRGSLHPLYAAYMCEIPKCNTLRLVQNSVEAEKEQMSRDDCLRWPDHVVSDSDLSSVTDFQREYVDIIPDTWTAVSLALNEDRDELYVTRYESGYSPFLLRLPLARHASRDMDEEEFSFEDGKRDFDEIIELSDFSTRTAKDMTSREARQQWWAEREALDTRLQELLINMENIWLGGFKSVFSQHERQSGLLARFRKSLETVLQQHLPSRRKKSQQTRPVLDTRVLELFIGLGDATDEEIDMDEALMDLIYFIVDILQFNGEHNAYDEIDFDAMVVETHDALRAYHSASHKLDVASRHMILILDKNLHAFPWEALPCLEQLSISRLPSLAALRERLLNARSSRSREDAAPGHYISTFTGGTSILNPSGDLAHTSKTIKPYLSGLQGSWNHITNRAPSEKEFEESLKEKDLVLYFGHGSGAQYIKAKSVRRLYTGQEDERNYGPRCATTLLFGCSSVHLTENGIYEPSGMLASYLTAGAPAVVGMLWDVTDKDCDRFAVKAGELWGLWPEPHQDTYLSNTPAKTPAKKPTKGKGRVAQLVQEVDEVRVPGSAKKARKGKGKDEPDMQVDDQHSKGVGLDEAVRDARQACVLRYLNGAAAVVYGIPVYLE